MPVTPSFRHLSVATAALAVVVTSSLAQFGPAAQTHSPTATDAPAARTGSVTRLAEVRVEAEAEHEELVHGPFLPPVEGTRILAGKRTSVMDLDDMPRIVNNNYRQATAKVPGLVLSEETTTLVSLGYRGLDPHRAQFIQVLKDGLPIHADMLGYPEAYYTPPLDTVDRIEFIRGGAGLMYGPQVGGALNYVTHRPRLDRPFSFRTSHVFGSDNYYSTFTHFDGTSDRLGYYGYYNHRQTDGFRQANSEVNLYAGSIKLVLNADRDSRWLLTLDAYEEQHGEPGGLTLAQFAADPTHTTRLHDKFELRRYFASLVNERDISESTRVTFSAWGGYYSRFSYRQRGGGFGTRPTGPDAETNSIEKQEFWTWGTEARLRHDWEGFGGLHTFSGGAMLYHTDSPRRDLRGAAPNARDGELRNRNHREVWYGSLFTENRFSFGSFSITPGFRLDNIYQSVRESVNVERRTLGLPLANEGNYRAVPLFGIGTAYEVAPQVELYGNVSQAYRPKIFTQAVPTGGTVRVPDNLQESRSLTYEIGFRGNPRPWVWWDTSLFYMDFSDQIGSIALDGGLSTLANVGRSRHYGWDAAAEVDVIGAFDAARGTDLASRLGSLNIYGNVTLLEAEFISGPLDGRRPRFAPDYLVRTGLIYRWRDRFKVGFLGTFHGSQFATDDNNPERFIPAYDVWDLTVEAKIYRDYVSVFAGVNNIFDRSYFARVRDDGIDPAYGRNFYGGFSFGF